MGGRFGDELPSLPASRLHSFPAYLGLEVGRRKGEIKECGWRKVEKRR